MIKNFNFNKQVYLAGGTTYQLQKVVGVNDRNEVEDYQIRRYSDVAKQGALFIYWGERSTWRAVVGGRREDWVG